MPDDAPVMTAVPFSEFGEALTLMSSPTLLYLFLFAGLLLYSTYRIRFVILIWSQFFLGVRVTWDIRRLKKRRLMSALLSSRQNGFAKKALPGSESRN